MRSYETARNLYSFLGFCAGAVIVLGIIMAFVGGSAAQALGRSGNIMPIIMAALPGVLIALGGTYGQALVQMGRTSVDTAEYAQQALAVSRQQLEISREALAQGKTAAASYAELLKRQPAAQSNSPDTKNNVEPGTSYSTRTEEAELDTPLIAQAEQTALRNEKSNPPAQLENAPAVKVEDMSASGVPVVFEKGMWQVGGRTFQSEAPARNYAAQLGVNPNAKLADV
jgi:hypothetical protein